MMNLKKINVGIVGGTGYTGVELLRLLVQHPAVHIQAITSRSEEGLRVAEMFPNLRGHCDLLFSLPDINILKACDLVFFATPNGVAMNMVPELLDAGVKVIDLAADFRIKDITLWEQWYGMQHACPEKVAEAVYGLPEINRELIRNARLIANPGCYPTAVHLGFMPLLKAGIVDTKRLIADAKSGASGAGRKANTGTLLCEVSGSFKPYAVNGHRHLPEIEQGLQLLDKTTSLTFVPHLLPMTRGIEATLYADLKSEYLDMELSEIRDLYQKNYANEPFVDVMEGIPETRSVKGANFCRLAVYRPQGRSTLVIVSVIDNLVKGAAGQAVQNMNILFDLDETLGLMGVALLP